MEKTKQPMTASEMGKKGGKARVAKMTPTERSEQMRKLVKRRWRLAKAKKKAGKDNG
jgi:hypothetical protein